MSMQPQVKKSVTPTGFVGRKKKQVGVVLERGMVKGKVAWCVWWETGEGVKTYRGFAWSREGAEYIARKESHAVGCGGVYSEREKTKTREKARVKGEVDLG